ncbi:MAG: penicillin-insensitive murein endopeptidase [Deltaproteobacteria bacterium]|nr:penicillin-insensitive murein endopeptidase [Deltaproteobacteria bacterium]
MRRGLFIWGLLGMALIASAAAARPPHIERNAAETPAPPPKDGDLRPGGADGPKDSAQPKSRRERERFRGQGARDLPSNSRSVGLPFAGRLRRGVQVVQSDYLRYTGEYAAYGNFWGTWELVQLVERAAYRVHQRVPGAKLSIGELSKASGGDIDGHASHEAGRDVDISFYMLDGRGEPVEPWAFANIRDDGTALPPNEGMRFDDRRNYELVQKLLTDGDARVQYIFVGRGIKRRILAEARRQGARATVIDRMEASMVQPAGGHPHRNHFHVRIYCAPADRPSCEDRAPFHAWYPGTPPDERLSLLVNPVAGGRDAISRRHP